MAFLRRAYVPPRKTPANSKSFQTFAHFVRKMETQATISLLNCCPQERPFQGMLWFVFFCGLYNA